jgi:signal transduction histidine kinase
MGDGNRRWRSVRVRTTVAASLVVGLALVLASAAMVVFLGRSLTSNVRDAALGRAAAVAAAIGSGAAPDLESGEADDEFVQVLFPDGQVAASSANVAGEPALASLLPGGEVVLDEAPLEDGPVLVVATAVSSADDGRTVLLGRSLDDVQEATNAAVPLLAVGVPLLVLVVAAVTWWITGRALRPVEAIRGEVETISASGLDRRVPEPATGDEIARLATTMNRMLGRLEGSQVRQRRFVSDAAHELRSPVASIRQHSEVAIAHPDGTSVGDLAEVVHRENLRVERLVDDLLLLARLDEHAHTTREQVDLDDLALEEAARLRSSTRLTIETSGVGPARVRGNRAALERAIRNVTDNAARHASRVVAISVSEVDGDAVVSVDDDGPGVDADDRERVFDRFVRLDDARTRGDGGAGLGLAIVRAVVEAHGGGVTLSEAPLGGARAELRLPIDEV